jgi:AcrR family transcriptional regulator
MESREQHKRRQVLDGAEAAFLELGFEGSSVDEIARRAGVSKGTLYNHFPDKRKLFAAVVDRECQRQAEKVFTVSLEDVPAQVALRRIGTQYLDFLLSPFAIRLFRVAVAESARFPELGRTFWESGPDLGTRRLAQFLAAAVARGELQIDDLDLASHQFIELCKAKLFYAEVFGVSQEASAADRERVVDAAVRTFLAAHAPARS